MKKALIIVMAIILGTACSKDDTTTKPDTEKPFTGVVTAFKANCLTTRGTFDKNESQFSWQNGDTLNLMEVSNNKFTGSNQIFTYDQTSSTFKVSGGTGLAGGKHYLACYSSCPVQLPKTANANLLFTPTDVPDYNLSATKNVIYLSADISPKEDLSVDLKPLFSILWIGFDTSLYNGEEFVANEIKLSATDAFMSKVAISGNGEISKENSTTYSDLDFKGLNMTINRKIDIAAEGSTLMCKVIPNPYANTGLDYGFTITGKKQKDSYTLNFITKMDDQPLLSGKYELQVPIRCNPDILSGDYKFESFGLTLANNPTLGKDVLGNVDAKNKTVTITLPSYWTSLSALVPTFTTSSNVTAVKIGATTQTSGVTSNDYTQTVTYTMEGTISDPQQWTVKIVRPTLFYIPDAILRNYLQSLNASMFAGDYLIIANALASGITTIDVSDKGVGDFAGVEFFPDLTKLMCPGAKASSVDLSHNNNIQLVQWWFAQLSELNISNCTFFGLVINNTAGPQISRLICRNTYGVIVNSPQLLSFVDFRGSKAYNGGFYSFDYSRNCTYSDNAKVMMDKEVWDIWTTQHPEWQQAIKAGKNMTLELYDPTGTTLVQTLKFNE